MNVFRGFHLAAFAPDGEFMGVGFWETRALSQKWLTICADFLAAHGDSFRASWGQQLAHIETQLTSDSGAALGSFYVHGQIAVSSIYLGGRAPAVDSEVLDAFLQSLRRTREAAGRGNEAFESLRTIAERPLAGVIVWENPKISELDADLVRELSTHFAAAYFSREAE